jgi:hypothetical protein
MPETISPASGSRRGNPRMEPPANSQKIKTVKKTPPIAHLFHKPVEEKEP